MGDSRKSCCPIAQAKTTLSFFLFQISLSLDLLSFPSPPKSLSAKKESEVRDRGLPCLPLYPPSPLSGHNPLSFPLAPSPFGPPPRQKATKGRPTLNRKKPSRDPIPPIPFMTRPAFSFPPLPHVSPKPQLPRISQREAIALPHPPPAHPIRNILAGPLVGYVAESD